jgi:3-phosphoshikimate 1-carboxyvinyltransferase
MKTSVTAARPLRGTVSVPGDKSISHRAVMLGALAQGTTEITGFLSGEDCLRTIAAFQQMGIPIQTADSTVRVHGRGLRGLKAPSAVLDAGNSGTTTRLLMGILAGQPFRSIIDGDPSLKKRPMARVTEPLREMGAAFLSPEGENRLPLTIQGGHLKGISYTLPVASAQIKSSILLATLFADGPSTVQQPAPSRDHTEIMLRAFGGRVEEHGTSLIGYPAAELYGQKVKVPGDISSAAFFMTAALLIPGSAIVLKNTGINPTRTGILEVYRGMGADIQIQSGRQSGGEPAADLLVSHAPLRGTVIEGDLIPRLIDELPIIALAATQAQGTTIIRDAAELKVKESDRIATVAGALNALGAQVLPTRDGMIIEGPTPLQGTALSCHMDHRIAMMGAIGGLIARGETVLDGGEWVDVSYPGFFEEIKRLQST